VFGVEREMTGGYDLERGSRLLRYITGLRAYPVDERKGRYWARRNLQKDLSLLKQYLTRARRAGRVREADELLKLIKAVGYSTLLVVLLQVGQQLLNILQLSRQVVLTDYFIQI
jgi:hypothetical protein